MAYVTGLAQITIHTDVEPAATVTIRRKVSTGEVGKLRAIIEHYKLVESEEIKGIEDTDGLAILDRR